MQRKKQYTSMQQELAAKKAAGYYGDLPQDGQSHSEVTGGSGWQQRSDNSPTGIWRKRHAEKPDASQKRKALIIRVIILAVCGLAVVLFGIFYTESDPWDDPEPDDWTVVDTDDNTLSEDSGYPEVYRYILNSTETSDTTNYDRLIPWYKNLNSLLAEYNVGEITKSIVAGRIIICAQCSEADDPNDVLAKWASAYEGMCADLEENNLHGVTIVVVIREYETYKLRLLTVNDEIRFASGGFADY